MSTPARPQVVRVIPPKEWMEKQIRNLRSVGEANYKVGISYPKADPIQKAIQKEEKYKARMRQVIEQDLHKKGLEGVTMDDWFKYAQDIGAGRLVEGVVKREAKVQRFVQNWVPLLLDHLSKIDSMPDVTDRDREERMLANLRGLKALKLKWKAGAR